MRSDRPQQPARRHPVLAADLLASHAWCQRLFKDARKLAALLLAASLGVLLLVLAARQFSASLAAAFAWLSTHELWAVALLVLYGLLQVSQLRIRAEQHHAQSWLVAATPAPGLPVSALLWRTLWPWAAQLATVLALVALAGARYLLAAELWLLAGWILIGGVLGACSGWWRGGRQVAARPRYEDSRYVPRVRDHNPQHRPSLAALSRWPVARALAWYRPENARLFVFVVIASMPAGTSLQSGACALLIAFLLSYAGALARAVLETGNEAANWLQGTPTRFVAFAWPLMRRAVLHQLALSFAVAALLLPLGATLVGVAYLVALWLTLVLMSWCVWLQGCFVGQRPWLKTVGSIATTLGAEQVVRGAGIAGALLWTCWNLRRRPS